MHPSRIVQRVLEPGLVTGSVQHLIAVTSCFKLRPSAPSVERVSLKRVQVQRVRVPEGHLIRARELSVPYFLLSVLGMAFKMLPASDPK